MKVTQSQGPYTGIDKACNRFVLCVEYRQFSGIISLLTLLAELFHPLENFDPFDQVFGYQEVQHHRVIRQLVTGQEDVNVAGRERCTTQLNCTDRSVLDFKRKVASAVNDECVTAITRRVVLVVRFDILHDLVCLR
ncbi:hypothetical protein D3C81_1852210 [compost metagenome]